MDDFTLYLAAGQSLHPVADRAIDVVLVYWPGVALCVGAYMTFCVVAEVRDRRAVRRQLRAERQQMLRFARDIQNAPQIPTQPGSDNDLLDACEAAWNTEPRKETP